MRCPHDSTKVLKTFYESNNNSLKIFYCNDCNQIFMYRYQFHAGSGSDCFIVYPGEKERGIEFSFKEFIEVLKENKDDLIKINDWYYSSDIKISEIEKIVTELNEMKVYIKNIYKMLLNNFEKKVDKN